MKSKELKKFKLPDNPGVYFFMKKEKILYIGKATSLKSRVKSYFSKDLIMTRGPMTLDMVTQSDKIKWQKTDSVLEALILEAQLIKKYQPKYNIKEKDDKSFNYVCITKEKLPKVLIIRGKELIPKHFENSSRVYNAIFGPFPNGSLLKEAMKIIRRIFPYIDEQSSKKNNYEFYRQIGLVPGVASQKHTNSSRFTPEGPYATQNLNVSASLQYNNNIKNLKLFFEGKKKSVISNFKKEMLSYAKNKEFEKANEIKKRIFALEHINDVALIKEDITQKHQNSSRFTPEGPYATQNSYVSALQNIEAFDVAHMSGKNMVGVMVVVEDGEAKKSEYKKFIIRTQSGANDTGALEEILSRRFRHTEWGIPSLVVVDGSTAQINTAKRVFSRFQFKIPVVGVVKDDKHKAKAIMGDVSIINANKKAILLSNSEAHRFAISFYRQKSRKNMLK